MRQFVEDLKRNRFYAPQVAYHQYFPSRKAWLARLARPLPPPLAEVLEKQGIGALYAHQAAAVDKVDAGKNVVVATPTASGKTLVYNLPVLSGVLRDPEARALYIFPLKALEQDQRKALLDFTDPLQERIGGGPEIYDGDTSAYKRKKMRASVPPILITNPDMVHLSLLPFHSQWEGLFRNLRFVVIDELHTYKGIFGSHLAQVIRRLNRICDFYGSRPQYIACSATIANPRTFAERLTGLTFESVEESGAPRAGRHFLFLNPAASPYTLAAKLFVDCLDAGFRTLVFTQARKITELLHAWVLKDRPQLKSRVSSYRAGFLPEERREIEAKLVSGEMRGVISTSALELGIDIGGLDVCLLVGYPGTVAATWQRGGRVGRADRESLVALLAQPDALDQYFMRHPEDFFGRGFESAVVDPDNPVVTARHLVCAAAEIPLRTDEGFFPLPKCASILEQLVAEGELLKSASGREWFSHRLQPHRFVDIRSAGEGYTIFEETTKRVIGRIGTPRVYSECHPGAIYLHKAESYWVKRLDQGKREVWAARAEADYYTKALAEKQTEILSTVRSRPMFPFTVCFGKLKVTERVRGFEKRRIFGQELLGVHELDMPPHIFETMGLWMVLPEDLSRRVRDAGLHFMGGIHAIEHAAISLFPLFVLCDRNDVGGICYPVHPQLETGGIFIYDGYPGGVGLAEHGYEILEELLGKARDLVRACPCLDGCPSCIHSPKCGSGNKPLDKGAAEALLGYLLGEGNLGKRAGEEEKTEVFSAKEVTGSAPDSVRCEPEAAAKPAPPEWLREKMLKNRILFLDVETQRSAEEVGGWQNKHLMRVATAVIYDSREEAFAAFGEDRVHELIERLKTADLVVGFNIVDFDYQVLKGYSAFRFADLKTFDLLQEISKQLGYRLSLNHLAHKTLNREKSADGLKSLQWFKEGKMAEVVAYCEKDVEITRDLFLFGAANGYLLFETKNGRSVRLPVEWKLETLLGAKK
jgi:DEAD/DEAH box helicase domain-containing protein